MKILVTAASKHGSTLEIAEAIGAALRTAGHEVDVQPAAAVRSLVGYETAVIGSAIYMGGWMEEARRLVETNQPQLSTMPVWLFSSGPLGAENPQPTEPLAEIPALMEKTGARAHQVFVGALKKENLSLSEKVIAKAVKAPYGDFRDWDAVREWAAVIAAECTAVSA